MNQRDELSHLPTREPPAPVTGNAFVYIPACSDGAICVGSADAIIADDEIFEGSRFNGGTGRLLEPIVLEKDVFQKGIVGCVAIAGRAQPHDRSITRTDAVRRLKLVVANDDVSRAKTFL